MHIVRGTLRFLGILPLLFLGPIVLSILLLIPVRIQRVRLSAWMATWMARLFLKVFGIQFRGVNLERLKQHQGFVFPNHESYLDMVVLMNVMPVRFLSNHKVKYYPFLGWMAIALDTVFVNRTKRKSRVKARGGIIDALRKMPYPPLVLFPEGAIGAGEVILPFHVGAFKMAVQEGIAYLPCVLYYDRMDLIPWFKGESLFAATWRVASRPGPIQAVVIALDVVHPDPEADPKQLMDAAREAIMAAFEAESEAAIPRT